LIGKEYGYETAEGVSATELEYQLAQKEAIFSLAYIKPYEEKEMHHKEVALFKNNTKPTHLQTFYRYRNIAERSNKITCFCLATARLDTDRRI